MSKNDLCHTFYDSFSHILKTLSLPENVPLVLAVSGGSDSMALLYLMSQWSKSHDRTCHVVTIDHGLRLESASEVLWVQKQCEALEMHCERLTLDLNQNQKTSIQERAREARFEALFDVCKRLGGAPLFLAHHADDQLETFVHRLVSGSGIDGLAGMSVKNNRLGIDIFRPLLSFKKKDLTLFLQERNLSWLEDPSNEKDVYTRVRIRKFLEEEGLSSDRFSTVCKRIERARTALDDIAQHQFDQFASVQFWGEITFDYQRWISQPTEIQLRLLEKMIRKIRKNDIEYMSLSGLEKIVYAPEQRHTLHGCLIDKKDNEISVVREPLKQVITIIDNELFVWDARFKILGGKGFYVRPYKEEDATWIKKQKDHYLDQVPSDYRLSTPIVCDEHGNIQASILLKQHETIEITSI